MPAFSDFYFDPTKTIERSCQPPKATLRAPPLSAIAIALFQARADTAREA